MSVLIYLDVCCLNRPFDDQTQERVRLESEAVLLILGRCQRGEWQLMGSEAIALEINQTRDSQRKSQWAGRQSDILQVKVANPVRWLLEVMIDANP